MIQLIVQDLNEILTWFFHSGRSMDTQGTPTQTSGAPACLTVSFLLSHQSCPDSQTSGTAVVCLLFPLQSGNYSQSENQSDCCFHLRVSILSEITSLRYFMSTCGKQLPLIFLSSFLMIVVKGLVWASSSFWKWKCTWLLNHKMNS